MDTKANGQPADTYEQRDELVLRSAAGDPTVERRSTPSARNPHAKQLSVSELESAQIEVVKPASDRVEKDFTAKQNAQSRVKEHSQSTATQTIGIDQKKAQSNRNNTNPLPEFILQRNELFDKLKSDYHTEVLAKEKPEIDVVLELGLDKDGKPSPEMPVAAKAWESTPGSFLRHVDKDISSNVVIAKVNGKQLWDLDRPLEYPCRLSYVPFSSSEGRNVFWHSSAHVLGEAAECQYNCLLSHGPPVEQGFFYDMDIGQG